MPSLGSSVVSSFWVLECPRAPLALSWNAGLAHGSSLSFRRQPTLSSLPTKLVPRQVVSELFICRPVTFPLGP